MLGLSGKTVLITGACLSLVVPTIGCDNAERYVITDTAPFFQSEIELDKTQVNAVVSAVQSFSQRHQMDFLLAQKSLGPGEFNASANGPLLNIRVMHTEIFDKGMSVSAIARGDATPQQAALVKQFVAEISEAGKSKVSKGGP